MRHRLPLAAAALAAALAVSASALAATPRSGCFGRCGGVPGVGVALMPSLVVQNGRVFYFTFPSYCLGYYKVEVTERSGVHTVKWPDMVEGDHVSVLVKNGAFSWTGRALYDNGTRSGAGRLTVTVTGRFRTPTLVAGTFSIQYPGCRKTGFAASHP